MKIYYNNADNIVNRASENVFWNGWDIVIFDPDINGYMRKNGMYRNNIWGVQTTISPDHNGMWNVPRRYERFFNRTRS